MTLRADTPGQVSHADPAIETMRGVAVLLLIAYHVIGPGPNGGMGLAYPEPLRAFADIFGDIRMPLFAFIAGWVYGLKPVRLETYGRFVWGKIRRLMIPGAVAAILFAVADRAMGGSFSMPLAESWRILVMPYAHFWFLQAIFLIFVLYGLLDALFRGRATAIFLGLSIVLYFASPYLPEAMSAKRAAHLLPSFLLGLLAVRHIDLLRERRGLVLLVATAALAWATWVHVQSFLATGRPELRLLDVQSIAVAFSTTMLALLALPRIRVLEMIGPFAFTIYLYHIFGTSGARQALGIVGIDAQPAVLVAGLAAGLAVPIVVHKLAELHPLGRRLILGQRA